MKTFISLGIGFLLGAMLIGCSGSSSSNSSQDTLISNEQDAKSAVAYIQNMNLGVVGDGLVNSLDSLSIEQSPNLVMFKQAPSFPFNYNVVRDCAVSGDVVIVGVKPDEDSYEVTSTYNSCTHINGVTVTGTNKVLATRDSSGVTIVATDNDIEVTKGNVTLNLSASMNMLGNVDLSILEIALQNDGVLTQDGEPFVATFNDFKVTIDSINENMSINGQISIAACSEETYDIETIVPLTVSNSGYFLSGVLIVNGAHFEYHEDETVTVTLPNNAGTYTMHQGIKMVCDLELGFIISDFADPQMIADYKVKAVGLDTSDGTLVLTRADGGGESTTFPFIWIANSGESTISKIDVKTGLELARYRTGSSFRSWNPSRTTVDQDGNVWVGNRSGNTITKVGLNEWDQCIDRNGNGVIDTSTGPTDIRAWSVDPEDECILHHVAMQADGVATPTDIRLVAITPDNNVFVGGYYSNSLFKVDNQTGVIIKAVTTKESHYGGVVDKFGNLWSMRSGSGHVEKINADMNVTELINLGHNGYGITIDKYGKVWTTEYGQRFSTFDPSDPSGTLQVFLQTGNWAAQGVASDSNGDIFIAGSLSYNKVGHYRQTFDEGGNFTGVEFVTNYIVGNGPTGVAVDANGLVWSSNYYSSSVSRIDPVTGAVDSYAVGKNPYNYSDMTGNVVRTVTKRQGTWEAVFDTQEVDFRWTKAVWNLKVLLPAGTSVRVFVKTAAEEISLNAAVYVEVQNDEAFAAMSGRFLKVKVELSSEDLDSTPELIRLRIQ